MHYNGVLSGVKCEYVTRAGWKQPRGTLDRLSLLNRPSVLTAPSSFACFPHARSLNDNDVSNYSLDLRRHHSSVLAGLFPDVIKGAFQGITEKLNDVFASVEPKNKADKPVALEFRIELEFRNVGF